MTHEYQLMPLSTGRNGAKKTACNNLSGEQNEMLLSFRKIHLKKTSFAGQNMHKGSNVGYYGKGEGVKEKRIKVTENNLYLKRKASRKGEKKRRTFTLRFFPSPPIKISLRPTRRNQTDQ